MQGEDRQSHRIQEFVAHSTDVSCVALSPKSCQILATGGEDHKVNIWRVGSSSNLWTLGSNKSSIQSLCFDNVEQNVVSGAMNGSIKVFDLNEGRLARQISGHAVNVTCLQFHGFGEFIVSGSLDCSMKVWDVRTKNCLQTYTGHNKEITCVRFSPDGRWVTSSSKDGQLHIWDLVAGKLLQTLKQAPAYVSSFEFSPEDLLMACVSSTRCVKLWDINMDNESNPAVYSFKQTNSTVPEPSPIRCMSFASGGNLFTATKDSIRMWNGEKKLKLVGSLDMNWDKISELKVCPDESIIGVSYVSNFVSVWSINQNSLTKSEASNNVEAKASPPKQQHSNSNNSNNSNNRNPSIPVIKTGSNLNSEYPASVPVPLVAPEKRTSLNLQANPNILPSNPSRNKQSEDIVGANNNGRSSINQSKESPPPKYKQNSGGNNYEIGDSKAISRGSKSEQSRKQDGDSSGCGVGDDNDDFDAFNPNVSDSAESVPGSGAAVVASSSRRDSKAGGDDADDSDANKNQPAIEWSSENAAKELASSMGESFWRRYQINLMKSSGSLKDKDKDLNVNEGDGDGDGPNAPSGSDMKGVDKRVVNDETMSLEEQQLIEAEIKKINEKFDVGNSLKGKNDEHNEQNRQVSAASNAVGVHSSSISNNRISPNKPNIQVSNNKVSPQQDQVFSSKIGGSGASTVATPAPTVTASSSSSSSSSSSTNQTNPVPVQLERLLTCSSLTVVFSQRLTAMKVLRRMWERGDLSGVIDYLITASSSIKHDKQQLIVLSDFFNAVSWKGTFVTLDICTRLMPVLESMICGMNQSINVENVQTVNVDNLEYVTLSVMKCLCELGDGFGEVIRSNANSRLSTGVDLNREERVRKCTICYECMRNISSRFDAGGIRRRLQLKDEFNSLYDKFQSFM